MKKRHVDMLHGPITKGLLVMTMPIMIMNVMQSLFNIIDMTVLRFFSGDDAVGEVGASGMLITLCTSILIGISSGANVVVAKRIGMGDRERADKATITAVMMSVVGGIALMIIGVIGAETFVRLTNCPKELIEL